MCLHSAAVSAERCEASGPRSRPLDVGAFPAFAGLLEASQEYARLSGCRFRSRDFEGLRNAPTGNDTTGLPFCMRAVDEDHRHAAKLAALDAIQEFSKRVRDGERELIEELDDACRLATEEGIRSAMVTTCQRLELWPPSSTLVSTQPPTTEFQAESLPARAQRLYEEEMARHGGEDQALQRARTAAFLADFGHAAGAPEPPMPEHQALAFQEFTETALKWEQQAGEPQTQAARQTRTKRSFVKNPFDSSLAAEAERWVSAGAESQWLSFPLIAAASVLAQAASQGACRRRKTREMNLLPVTQFRRAAMKVGA